MGDVNEDLQQKLQINISVINNCVPIGSHCLICNSKLYPEKIEGQKEVVYLFQAQTTATQHDVYILLGNLVGKEISAKQIHSDIICRRCFRLLDRIDFLQEELSNAKEKIIRQFQQTDLVHVSKAKIDIEDSPSDRGLMGTENVNSIEQSEGLSERLCVPPNHNAVIRLPQEDSSQENTNLPLFPSKDYLRTVIEHPSKRIPLIGFDKDPGDTEEEHPDKTELWENAARSVSLEENLENLYSTSHRDSLPGLRSCCNCQSVLVIKTSDKYCVPCSRILGVGKIGTVETENSRKDCDSSSKNFDCNALLEELSGTPLIKADFRKTKTLGSTLGDVKMAMAPNFIRNKMFTCEKCGVMLPTDKTYYLHVKRNHPEIGEFSCNKCRVIFSSKSAMYSHQKSQHQGFARCNVCGTLVKKSYLSNHISAVHTREKEHKCSGCDKVFYSLTNLQNHQRWKHQPRAYSCHICQKGFVHKLQLDYHLKVHSNQKDFTCDMCGKAYFNERSLLYHIRTHTGERPHKCNFCQEAFIRSDSLKKHMEKHFSRSLSQLSTHPLPVQDVAADGQVTPQPNLQNRKDIPTLSSTYLYTSRDIQTQQPTTSFHEGHSEGRIQASDGTGSKDIDILRS